MVLERYMYVQCMLMFYEMIEVMCNNQLHGKYTNKMLLEKQSYRREI